MDAVVAVSPLAASYLERSAEVILHGVDTEEFRPAQDRSSLKRDLGLAPGTWVGSFGRLRAQKGTDLLVRAMLRLMPQRPTLKCLIVGRADEQAFLEEIRGQISHAGLADRFVFVETFGWPELARHHAAMDLYVAPPRWEGFGLTPLEAMSCGVPVVATTVGAFPDIVPPSGGRLVPPDDLDALSVAIAVVLDDDALRARMGDAGRAHVEASFGIEREAEALIAVYRRLLAT